MSHVGARWYLRMQTGTMSQTRKHKGTKGECMRGPRQGWTQRVPWRRAGRSSRTEGEQEPSGYVHTRQQSLGSLAVVEGHGVGQAGPICHHQAPGLGQRAVVAAEAGAGGRQQASDV
jgi:hypothetical protein